MDWGKKYNPNNSPSTVTQKTVILLCVRSRLKVVCNLQLPKLCLTERNILPVCSITINYQNMITVCVGLCVQAIAYR